MQGVRDKIGLYLGLFRARGWHFLQLRKRSLSRLVSSVPAGSTPSSYCRTWGSCKKPSATMAQLAMPNCRETGGFGRSHSLSFDHRLRPDTLRTAMATAFFCPTSTTSFLPRVTPVRAGSAAAWRNAG